MSTLILKQQLQSTQGTLLSRYKNLSSNIHKNQSFFDNDEVTSKNTKTRLHNLILFR
jgi:hypothetical protein